MARDPRFQPLYPAFDDFLQRCILDNRSLLWPSERPWTPENVAEVRERLAQAPMLGGGHSFGDKLQNQMEGASSEHWMIICDVYYVYCLPSKNITLEKKRSYIEWAAGQAGLRPPSEDDEVWEPQKHGFTRTTLRYHHKYRQFWLILLFAEHLKSADDPESIISDPDAMQRVLDQLLDSIPSKNDRAYDMRHAMLYLAFPDQYERIISTRDKDRIVQTYGDRLEGPDPEDRDEVLRRIRRALSDQYDQPDRPFDFYDELKQEWRPDDEGNGNGNGEPGPPDLDVSTVLRVLEHTNNLILYGPPGGGKTYVASKAAEAFVQRQAVSQSTENFVAWTAFHQSYAYEDFVEGLRPVRSEGASEGIAYQVVPGVFRRVCSRAAEDPGNKYVLVIDEINRGNIAKILGELITLLEDDKRSGGDNPLMVTLPYSGDEFEVPGNLYIIGTMNTADRSIALLDVALRRRFAFVELMPRPELLRDQTVESAETTVALDHLLKSINRSIRDHLDRNHQIGHSYFLEVTDEPDEGKRVDVLEFVWNNRIVPLLEEYFYSQPGRLLEILDPFLTDVEPTPDVRSGEETDISFARLKGEDLMSALAKLAEQDEMAE